MKFLLIAAILVSLNVVSQGFTIYGKFEHRSIGGLKTFISHKDVKLFYHADVSSPIALKSALPIATVTTGRGGDFKFEVKDSPGTAYRIVGYIAGRTANLIVRDRTGGGSRRRRSLCSGVTVTLVDAEIYSEEEWQIITQWIPCTGVSSVADFDGITKTPMSSDPLNWKDSNDYLDEIVGSVFRNAYLGDDSSNADSPYEGVEITTIWEEGVATYKHLVYGYGSASSFVDSDVQVHVYRLDSNTYEPELVGSYLAEDSPTFNSDWRFFHAFTVDIDFPNDSYTLTSHEEVTCDPNLTLGTTSTQDWENGNRNC